VRIKPVTVIPGYNTDPIDIDAGLQTAKELGYDSDQDQMIVSYLLNLHRRGEEDIAQKCFLQEYGNNLTAYYRILASAVASGQQQLVIN